VHWYERQSEAMKTTLIVAALLITISASAGTRDNDNSCDVKVGPAATLLLPYFEVDLNTPGGQTTLFTITNVSRYSQIAHVTLWTDLAFPVLDFNIFLTGYDVQSINLLDVLNPGIVAPPLGTGPTTAKSPLGTAGSAPSLTSPANGGPGYTNPNFRSAINCDNLPGTIPQTLMAAVRAALTRGTAPGCSFVGLTHRDAIGYVTIDVVGSCNSRLPNDPLYYTTDLLFDNVLIGDYQQIGSSPAGTVPVSFDAGANPMVHLRAVPEGGAAGSNVPTELPFTFYDRYTPATNRAADRRQPLPATFAARFMEGGPSNFATNFTIWREGFGTGATCSTLLANASLPIADRVRFDERENPWVGLPDCGDPCSPGPARLPATSSTNTKDSGVYPTLSGSDVGGWMYLNLNNGGSTTYSVTTDIGGQPGPTNQPGVLAPAGASTTQGPRPSQNWVTITMFGNLGTNHLAGEFDAASLGNGCSPAAFVSTAYGGRGVIGPAGGVFVCPPGPTLTNGTTTQCTGTNVNPKP
jgi:hypothetical protein